MYAAGRRCCVNAAWREFRAVLAAWHFGKTRLVQGATQVTAKIDSSTLDNLGLVLGTQCGDSVWCFSKHAPLAPVSSRIQKHRYLIVLTYLLTRSSISKASKKAFFH